MSYISKILFPSGNIYHIKDVAARAHCDLIDPKYTVFDFGNGDVSAFNAVGNLTQALIDAGLKADGAAPIGGNEPSWIGKTPVAARIGTAVTDMSYVFYNC